MTYASQYYTYIALGASFIIVSYTPLNLLRTEGFATASMVGSILGAVVNMILDPVFIFTLGMGAAGAAIATVIGNICTDLFFLWFLYRSVFPVVSSEEKQEAVCRSQRISYPEGRTGTDLCHWDPGLCHKFNAESGNGSHKPLSPSLWK